MDGPLEVDVSSNSLQSTISAGMPRLRDGLLEPGVERGIRPAPSIESLAECLTACGDGALGAALRESAEITSY